jgi:hypothetical protein
VGKVFAGQGAQRLAEALLQAGDPLAAQVS